MNFMGNKCVTLIKMEIQKFIKILSTTFQRKTVKFVVMGFQPNIIDEN